MKTIYKLLLLLSGILLIGQTSVFAKTQAVKTATTTQVCDSNGWCEVPLTDTQSFNRNCNYRFYQSSNGYPSAQYANAALDFGLLFRGTDGTGYAVVITPDDKGNTKLVQDDNMKNIVLSHYLKVDNLQERCKIPNKLPKRQVSLFHLTQCPVGWKLYNPNTMPGATSTLIQCEKE